MNEYVIGLGSPWNIREPLMFAHVLRQCKAGKESLSCRMFLHTCTKLRTGLVHVKAETFGTWCRASVLVVY